LNIGDAADLEIWLPPLGVIKGGRWNFVEVRV
jgi:hypothetical protein